MHILFDSAILLPGTDLKYISPTIRRKGIYKFVVNVVCGGNVLKSIALK